MLITESQIYWITRMDYINGFSVGLLVFSIAASIISIICILDAPYSNGYSKPRDKANSKIIKCLIISIALLLISASGTVFIPTTKTMCAIKVVPLIVNNKEVQELPSKIVETANEWLYELKPNKGAKNEN